MKIPLVSGLTEAPDGAILLERTAFEFSETEVFFMNLNFVSLNESMPLPDACAAKKAQLIPGFTPT